ncbi:hypothetical protein D3C73_1388680 [compost metagenome]
MDLQRAAGIPAHGLQFFYNAHVLNCIRIHTPEYANPVPSRYKHLPAYLRAVDYDADPGFVHLIVNLEFDPKLRSSGIKLHDAPCPEQG